MSISSLSKARLIAALMIAGIHAAGLRADSDFDDPEQIRALSIIKGPPLVDPRKPSRGKDPGRRRGRPYAGPPATAVAEPCCARPRFA